MRRSDHDVLCVVSCIMLFMCNCFPCPCSASFAFLSCEQTHTRTHTLVRIPTNTQIRYPYRAMWCTYSCVCGVCVCVCLWRAFCLFCQLLISFPHAQSSPTHFVSPACLTKRRHATRANLCCVPVLSVAFAIVYS